MPITSAKIDDKQVRAILALEEGHFLDLKSIDVGPAKLSKVISAFSNANGLT